MIAAAVIFLICIILWVIDKYPPAIVALAGCCAMVVFKAGTPQEVFAGFTNDIIWIVLGTEILGIACQESGLAAKTAGLTGRIPFNGDKVKYERLLVLVLGVIAAFVSAIINNQVVSVLVLVICTSIADKTKTADVKDITLPVIYFVILGGQCTLIGAPATLVAASIAADKLDKPIGMFELLPLGGTLLILGGAYVFFFGVRSGGKIWESTGKNGINAAIPEINKNVDKRKSIVVISAVFVMLALLITNTVSVGMAAVIAALICCFGKTVELKTLFSKIDWNIILWLGCCIGIANVLNSNDVAGIVCGKAVQFMPGYVPPVLLLSGVVIITIIISNLIANTTTVIMILPFAMELAQRSGLSIKPFMIAVTMAAGLSILTPLSCGFIGMTMRLGYRFKDYLRYGMPLQILLIAGIIILTPVFFPF